MARKKSPPGKPQSRRPGGRRDDRDEIRAGYSDPNDIRAIAVHEAGHAVAAVVMGLPLRGVDIRKLKLPDGRMSVGFTDCPVNPQVRDLRSLMPYMVQTMCGPLAEVRANPSVGKTGALDADRESLCRLAAIAVCEATERGDGSLFITPEEIRGNRARIDEVIKEAIERAEAMVSSYWGPITVTAYNLAHRGTPDGRGGRNLRGRGDGRPGGRGRDV